MSKPITFKYENYIVYNAEDVMNYDPIYFKGCSNRVRYQLLPKKLSKRYNFFLFNICIRIIEFFFIFFSFIFSHSINS